MLQNIILQYFNHSYKSFFADVFPDGYDFSADNDFYDSSDIVFLADYFYSLDIVFLDFGEFLLDDYGENWSY